MGKDTSGAGAVGTGHYEAPHIVDVGSLRELTGFNKIGGRQDAISAAVPGLTGSIVGR